MEMLKKAQAGEAVKISADDDDDDDEGQKEGMSEEGRNEVFLIFNFCDPVLSLLTTYKVLPLVSFTLFCAIKRIQEKQARTVCSEISSAGAGSP